MPKFKKYFITFMIVSTALVLVTLDTAVLMSYEYIPVNDEGFEAVKIIAFAVIIAIVFPAAALLFARTAVLYLRKRGYSLESSGELTLFRDFVLAEAGAIVINSVYLYSRSGNFFESAYAQQRAKLNALKNTKEALANSLETLKHSYESCLSYTKAAVIAGCVLQVIIMLWSARVLVKAYHRS